MSSDRTLRHSGLMGVVDALAAVGDPVAVEADPEMIVPDLRSLPFWPPFPPKTDTTPKDTK